MAPHSMRKSERIVVILSAFCFSKSSRKRKRSLWLNRPKIYKKRQFTQSETPVPQETSTLKKLHLAPKKMKTCGNKRGRKRLFDESLSANLTKEMISIMPSVIEKLNIAGIVHGFCTLLRLIASGKFPLTNIALILLLNVARWYIESLKFWKVMYEKTLMG